MSIDNQAQLDGENDDQSMPLIEHLRELRKRIIYAAIAFFIGFLVMFYFATDVLYFLIEPIQEVLRLRGESPRLIFTAPEEQFFALVRIAMLGGIAVSFPVIAYQLWAFIAPGLYKNEKGAVLPFILASPLMFLAGAAFAHYVVTPMAMNFFIGFADILPRVSDLLANGLSEVDPLNEEAKTFFLGSVRESLDLTLKFVLAFGVCFQLPVALTLLGKVGLVSSKGLASTRKYAVVGILTIAAFVTPPDVTTQLMLFSVVYGLYEISIWLVKWVEPEFQSYAVEE